MAAAHTDTIQRPGIHHYHRYTRIRSISFPFKQHVAKFTPGRCCPRYLIVFMADVDQYITGRIPCPDMPVYILEVVISAKSIVWKKSLACYPRSDAINATFLWIQRRCCRFVDHNANAIYPLGTALNHETIIT